MYLLNLVLALGLCQIFVLFFLGESLRFLVLGRFDFGVYLVGYFLLPICLLLCLIHLNRFGISFLIFLSILLLLLGRVLFQRRELEFVGLFCF